MITHVELTVRGYSDAAMLLPARQPDLDRDAPRYMDFGVASKNHGLEDLTVRGALSIMTKDHRRRARNE